MQQPYAFQNENEYQHGRYSADDAFASKKHGGLASGYLSDSHHDYNGGHTVNPFPKIPPIPIGSDDGMINDSEMYLFLLLLVVSDNVRLIRKRAPI